MIEGRPGTGDLLGVGSAQLCLNDIPARLWSSAAPGGWAGQLPPPPPAPLSLLMSVQEPQHLDVEVCLDPEMWQDA